MKNSDRFLVAFNSIEHEMKIYADNEHYVPFSRLIQIGRRSNAVVRRYYEELKEFIELRNAIVHNTTDLNYAIAEPHDDVVKKIEFIEQEIKKPKKVIPLFQKKVKTFQSTNTFREILQVVNRLAYSKFPIYEEKQFMGLLSKRGIVNWMGENVDNLEKLPLLDTKLKDILLHEEIKNNFRFISRDTTLYEVKDIFKELDMESPTIDAILITENGRKEEALLGIITPIDLINLP